MRINSIRLAQILCLAFLLTSLSPRFSNAQTLTEECKKIIHDEKSNRADRDKCLKDYLKVTVTANRVEQQLKNVPASVSVVSGRDLERPSADSIAGAVSDIPGVEVTDSGQSGLKRIRIRGEDASRITVLIDGQEFFDPRDVGTPLLISPELVERIEVLRGPASVVYGSRAMGGVINIITKKGGYHPIQGSASLVYDSNAEGFQEMGSIYGAKDGFDYRVAFAGADFDDRHSADGVVPDTGYENSSFLSYLGYRFNEQHYLSFNFSNYDSETDVYVEPEVRFSPPFRDFRIETPQRDRERYSLFYDYTGNPGAALTKVHLDGFLQHSIRQFDTYSTTVIDPSIELLSNTSIFSRSNTEGIGGNLYGEVKPIEPLSILIGVQSSNDDLEQTRDRLVAIGQKAPSSENVVDEASLTATGLYAVGRYEINSSWELDLGARQYWVSNDLDSTTRSGLSPNSTDDSEAVGSAALSYRGIENSLIWVKFAQGYQYPTLSQSATGAFAGPSFVNPNQDLDSETSDEVELGVRYDDDSVEVELAVFHSEADDYIDHVLCSSRDGVNCIQPTGARDRIYVNIDQATTFGAEGRVAYNIDQLSPYVQLTWIRRKFERSEYDTYDTGLPTVSSRLGVEYSKDLDSDSTFWSDLYLRLSSDSDEFDGTKNEHKAGWTTLNVATGLDFGEKRQYKVALELLNLLDKEYTPATENIPGKGVTALLRAAVSF